jgi:hypothetical protein
MENAKGLLIATAFLTGSLMTATECVARRLAGSKSAADAQTLGAGLTAEKMNECRWLLCRIRHSSHNVECRMHLGHGDGWRGRAQGPSCD